jgi:hypothetical protein
MLQASHGLTFLSMLSGEASRAPRPHFTRIRAAGKIAAPRRAGEEQLAGVVRTDLAPLRQGLPRGEGADILVFRISKSGGYRGRQPTPLAGIAAPHPAAGFEKVDPSAGPVGSLEAMRVAWK